MLIAGEAIHNLKPETDDEKSGLQIVINACEQPIRKLAENSGADGGWVVRKVTDEIRSKSGDKNFGFNALTLEFGDMLKMGILDPVKVTRSALQNAASVASMILTTETLITELPDKKDKTPSMPDMGGMGGM